MTLACGVAAEPLGIGQTPGQDMLTQWNIDIGPDGAGLPPGHGSVAEGKMVFETHCVACHALSTTTPALTGPTLAGGRGTLATLRPIRTVGSYWPYATTLFDYVRRAMPFNAPHSLSDDEVYAVTAYILRVNNILPDGAVLNATSLPAVQMPNRGGFKPVWPSHD
jgi:hypothetical protein